MGRSRTKPGRWDVDINYTVLKIVHVQTVTETDCICYNIVLITQVKKSQSSLLVKALLEKVYRRFEV